MTMPNLTEILQELYNTEKAVNLKKLFSNQPDRNKEWIISHDDLFFDYSRNLITQKQLQLLIQHAEIIHLKDKIEALMNGDKCNQSEDRPALHTALRKFDTNPIFIDGKDVLPEIKFQREKLRLFWSKIQNDQIRGSTGKKITTFVNVGIGGSFMGSKMSIFALDQFKKQEQIQFKFISHIDDHSFQKIIQKCNPETTAFIINSKSFTTTETVYNAIEIKKWLLDNLQNQCDLSKHFFAVTANKLKAIEFGIHEENIFLIWDWIGGRFSVSSSGNFPLLLSIGYDQYIQFLQGFQNIDQHFLDASFDKNIPVIMALISFWYITNYGSQSHAILPYSSLLEYLPIYLQQLHMESLGKSIDQDGNQVSQNTGEILWGGQGIISQHSFYQLLHQGTLVIPSDFIGYIKENTQNKRQDQHMAHFFAQQHALAFGHTTIEKQSLNQQQIITGNHPHHCLLFHQLTPYSLGQLIALYEHKTYCLSVLFNINAFDQYGVELGKIISNKIYQVLQTKDFKNARTYHSISFILEKYMQNN